MEMKVIYWDDLLTARSRDKLPCFVRRQSNMHVFARALRRHASEETLQMTSPTQYSSLFYNDGISRCALYERRQ